MTDDRFDEWMADLEERAQRGDPAVVLNEINESPLLELEPYELGRIRGLAVCCLEWCGMDPLAKGLSEEVCDGDPAAAVSAGIECSEMGELEYAEEILRTMCDRWPDSVYPPLNLGVVLQKQHEHHSAIEQFDKTLAIENDFPPALLERARSFRDLELYEDASRAYRQYLDVEPGDAWEWVSLGVVESEREEFGNALEAYDRARRSDPSCMSAHYNFGVTASRMEDDDLLENAIASLRRENPQDCRVFLLEAYRIESEQPAHAWELALLAIDAAVDADDPELCEHSVEIALNIGIRNGLTEECEIFIDGTITNPNAPPPVFDADRRLHGALVPNATRYVVRLEVEVTDPEAVALLTGDLGYEGPGYGYIRNYCVWAATPGEAEEAAMACENRSGYGRVVDTVDIETGEQADEEHAGVEWRSEMFGYELEREG